MTDEEQFHGNWIGRRLNAFIWLCQALPILYALGPHVGPHADEPVTPWRRTVILWSLCKSFVKRTAFVLAHGRVV